MLTWLILKVMHFSEMCSLRRVFIERTHVRCLRKCRGWQRRNTKPQPCCGGRIHTPASPFPGFYCNDFCLHSTKGACFLNLSSTRANSYIISPNITPVMLTCSSAGSNLISEERRVFTRISWKFLQHSLLHQLTCGYIHSQHSLPLSAFLCNFAIFPPPSLPTTGEPEI